MRVAVVGSRDISYTAKGKVSAYVRELDPDDVIISGYATGVDRLAEQAAYSNGMRIISFRPVNVGGRAMQEWAINRVMHDPGEQVVDSEVTVTLPERYPGFAPAAFVRNGYIVELAEKVAVFWNGKSKGTKDTLRKAEAAGLPIDLFRVDPEGQR